MNSPSFSVVPAAQEITRDTCTRDTQFEPDKDGRFSSEGLIPGIRVSAEAGVVSSIGQGHRVQAGQRASGDVTLSAAPDGKR